MHVLVHYAEIALKGLNRASFENKLVSNIKQVLNKHNINVEIEKVETRLLLHIKNKSAKTKQANKELITKLLAITPGISDFAFVELCNVNFDEIKQRFFDLFVNAYKQEKFDAFCIEVKRSYKQFPLTSLQIKTELAKFIKKRCSFDVNVDLKNGKKFYVEITKKYAILYSHKHKGIGGLPVSTAGKIVALISGGIDSPVAAFLAMKRGCSIVAVHFHNFTKSSGIVKDKVVRIIKQLSNVANIKLYMVPFKELQFSIIAGVKPKYRMLVYRFVMMKIANKIAQSEKAKAIVTGDSIGQVASQTLSNLNCIYQASDLAVLTPLIAYNKQEITQLAKMIGTYDLSIMPYEDCCSLMIAKHPATNAKPEIVEQFYNYLCDKFNLKKLEDDAIKKAKIYVF